MDDKKLNIAIFVGSALLSGGGFQYEARICKLLMGIKNDKFNMLFFTTDSLLTDDFKQVDISLQFLKTDNLEETLIKNYKIDLIYFLNPSHIAGLILNTPYIVTVWDLCHRDFNEFPEVRDNHEFEKRESYYGGMVLKKAVAVISDSDQGKSNLVQRYGLNEERVHVLKFLPPMESEYIEQDIKKKYNLDAPYVYYPAQFWPHKNHIYILKALKILKDLHNIKIYALFSGKDYGNARYVLEQAKSMGIETQIRYLGFVSNSEVPNLYKQSLALVMPTYFGPTNIPPLEAFFYETPVCYSDLNGLRDQVGDGAFLMDLKNPTSLADTLVLIMKKPHITQEKIKAGKSILKSWTEEDFQIRLKKIFDNFMIIRQCWGEASVPEKKLQIDGAFDWNLFINNIVEFQKSQCTYVVYGYGTIGKSLYAFLSDKVVAFVDQKSDLITKDISKGEVYNPKNIFNMQYDKIIISALGREDEIQRYLIHELGVDPNTIIKFNI